MALPKKVLSYVMACKACDCNWAISIYPFSEKWRSESSVTQHFRRVVYEYEPYKMPSTYTAVQLTALFCNLRHLFIRLGVISLITAPLNCRNFENSMCVSKARLDLPDLNGCAPYRQPIFQLSDTRERLCRDRLIGRFCQKLKFYLVYFMN